MINIYTFLYYFLFASAVLFYGIGLYRTAEAVSPVAESPVIFVMKALLSIYTTSTLSWLVTSGILVRLGLTEIYPLICLLIYICISSFLEALIRITSGASAAELSVSMVIITLSVGESGSLLTTLVICTACAASVLVSMSFFGCILRRRTSECEGQSKIRWSVILFMMAVMMAAVAVFDLSWLNPEVIR